MKIFQLTLILSALILVGCQKEPIVIEAEVDPTEGQAGDIPPGPGIIEKLTGVPNEIGIL